MAPGAASVHLCWQLCKLSTHRTSCRPRVLPRLTDAAWAAGGFLDTCTKGQGLSPSRAPQEVQGHHSCGPGAWLQWSWAGGLVNTRPEGPWGQLMAVPRLRWGEGRADHSTSELPNRCQLSRLTWEPLWGRLNGDVPIPPTLQHNAEAHPGTSTQQLGHTPGPRQASDHLSKEAPPEAHRTCWSRQSDLLARAERRADAEQSCGRRPRWKQPPPPTAVDRATQGRFHVKTALQNHSR